MVHVTTMIKGCGQGGTGARIKEVFVMAVKSISNTPDDNRHWVPPLFFFLKLIWVCSTAKHWKLTSHG